MRSALKQLQAVGSAESLRLEVSDRKAVAQAAKDILRRHGRIDIPDHSAGTNLGKRNWNNVEVEGWDEVVAINLSGLFYCCHAVLPAMRAQKDGLIINVSSWAGRYASTLTGPAYNATKRAVIALTESINAEECANAYARPRCCRARCDADPGEAPGAAAAGRPRKNAAGGGPGSDHPVPGQPAAARLRERADHQPTWNRFYLGGLEKAKA